jgi:hypothetical protein
MVAFQGEVLLAEAGRFFRRLSEKKMYYSGGGTFK